MNITSILITLDKWGFYTFRFITSFLWQASIILVFVLLFSVILRRKQAKARHILLVSVLFTIPFLPVLSWVVSTLGTPHTAIPVIPGYSAPQTELFSVMEDHPETGLPITEPESENPASTADNSQSDIQTFPSEPTEKLQVSKRESLFLFVAYPWTIVFAVYVTGASFFLVMFCAGLIRIRRWIKKSVLVTDPRILAVFSKAAKHIGLNKDFVAVECSAVPTSMTVGAVHPMILLPEGFSQNYTLTELEAIAIHELAHVKRSDSFTLMLVSLIRAIFFFHPLVWTASRQVSLLAEQACDDVVLTTVSEPVAYAKILSGILEKLPKRALQTELSAGFIFTKSVFFKRIEAILSGHRAQIRSLSRLALGGTITAAVISIVAALALPLGTAKVSEDVTASPENFKDVIKVSEIREIPVPYYKNVPVSIKCIDWQNSDKIVFTIDERRYGGFSHTYVVDPYGGDLRKSNNETAKCQNIQSHEGKNYLISEQGDYGLIPDRIQYRTLLKRINLKNGEMNDLALYREAHTSTHYSFTCSHDGNTIVYCSGEEIWAMTSDGSNSHRIYANTDTGPNFGALAFSPDDNKIIFAARELLGDRKWHLYIASLKRSVRSEELFDKLEAIVISKEGETQTISPDDIIASKQKADERILLEETNFDNDTDKELFIVLKRGLEKDIIVLDYEDNHYIPLWIKRCIYVTEIELLNINDSEHIQAVAVHTNTMNHGTRDDCRIYRLNNGIMEEIWNEILTYQYNFGHDGTLSFEDGDDYKDLVANITVIDYSTAKDSKEAQENSEQLEFVYTWNGKRYIGENIERRAAVILEKIKKNGRARLKSQKTSGKEEHSFEIYLTKEWLFSKVRSTSGYIKILEEDMHTAELIEKPFITDKDIIEYDWDSHTMTISKEAIKRIPELFTSFIVVADGKRFYAGCFWSSALSNCPPPIKIDRVRKDGILRIQTDYSCVNLKDDPRSHKRIKNSLQALGKLKVTNVKNDTNTETEPDAVKVKETELSESAAGDDMRTLLEQKYLEWREHTDNIFTGSSRFEDLVKIIYSNEVKEFHDIVKLGPPVVPYLLEKIENEDYFVYLYVLYHITKWREGNPEYANHPTKLMFGYVEEKPLAIRHGKSPATEFWNQWWNEFHPNIRQHFDNRYSEWKELRNENKAEEAEE